jgi:hypothetical protein
MISNQNTGLRRARYCYLDYSGPHKETRGEFLITRPWHQPREHPAAPICILRYATTLDARFYNPGDRRHPNGGSKQRAPINHADTNGVAKRWSSFTFSSSRWRGSFQDGGSVWADENENVYTPFAWKHIANTRVRQWSMGSFRICLGRRWIARGTLDWLSCVNSGRSAHWQSRPSELINYSVIHTPLCFDSQSAQEGLLTLYIRLICYWHKKSYSLFIIWAFFATIFEYHEYSLGDVSARTSPSSDDAQTSRIRKPAVE